MFDESGLRFTGKLAESQVKGKTVKVHEMMGNTIEARFILAGMLLPEGTKAVTFSQGQATVDEFLSLYYSISREVVKGLLGLGMSPSEAVIMSSKIGAKGVADGLPQDAELFASLLDFMGGV